VSPITIGEVAPEPEVPSLPDILYPEIVFPPVAGAEKVIEF
jgi:hypothetical protein